VDWEGRPLIDGLVVDNLPIDVAREYGAVVVVAVDVSSPRLEPEEYRSALGVATQVSDLLTARRNADFDSKADVLVRPELGPHPATRYSDLDMLVDRGHEAMKAAIPEIRAKLEAAGLGGALAPRPPPELKRVLDGTPIAEVTVRGNERISEGVLRRTFNIPTGPGFVLEKGLRAFDKIEATGLLEHVWMDLEPVPEGLRVVLVVREAPPNRIEIGAAFTEWERARGVLRLVNRNTLGSGEETSLLLVASEAEVGGRLDLRGDFPFLVGVGYQLEGFVSSDEPRDFDPAGEAIRRARYDRRGVGAALQVSLERWGLLEAGVRVGRVGEASGLGGGPPERSDDERALLLRVVVDDMDSLLWPEAGQRLALHGLWNVRDLGATHPFWRLRGEGRLGRRLGGRIVLQIDALAGLSDDRVPAYDWFRIGGPYLIPGYHHEELKGPQALAGAVSVRCRIIGDLQVVVRAGAGDVFASRDRIGFSHLRWGGGVGLMYPSRVGPLALDLGWRGGGAMLVSLALGWN
jgi:NTE family protein